MNHVSHSHLQVLLQRIWAEAAHHCEGHQRFGHPLLLQGIQAASNGIRRQQQLHGFAELKCHLLQAEVPLLPLSLVHSLLQAAVTAGAAVAAIAVVRAAGDDAVPLLACPKRRL